MRGSERGRAARAGDSSDAALPSMAQDSAAPVGGGASPTQDKARPSGVAPQRPQWPGRHELGTSGSRLRGPGRNRPVSTLTARRPGSSDLNPRRILNPKAVKNAGPTSSVDSQAREALKRRVLARRLDAARRRTPLHRMPPNVAVCVRREPCKRIRAQAAGDADATHKRRTLAAQPRQQPRHGQAHVRHAVIGEPHQRVRDGGARVGWERRVGRAQQASREVDEAASATGTSS